MLDLEGDEPAPNPKIDEFRQSAIEAKKERDRLAKELSDLQKQRDELASKVAPKEKEAQDLAGQVSNIQRLLDEERAARTNAEKKARAENFRSSLVNAAQTHKIRDEKASRALELIAGSVYKEEEDGTYKPYENGQIIYSKRKDHETKPMPVDEWVETQKTSDYKDLFSQPQGGGAKGSSSTAGAGSKGRIALTLKESQKPTPEQFKAMQENRVDIID